MSQKLIWILLDSIFKVMTGLLVFRFIRIIPGVGSEVALAMARILLADDDVMLCSMLSDTLRSQGYNVEVANNGDDAAQFIDLHCFDVIILDWNMPGCSGVELCKQLRRKGKKEPILLLTARSEIDDKEEGLYAGADDYLTKPFELRELIARVKSLLRRPTDYFDNSQSLGEITIEVDGRILRRNDLAFRLKPREYELLEFFLRRNGQLLSAEVLLSGVWGADFDGSEIALRSCLAKLRKVLSALGYPEIIETIHGSGYRLQIPQA